MRYVMGVALPALVQTLIVYIVIQINTGNGSWLGLGALLLGMFAIPATGVVNALYIKSSADIAASTIFLRCFGIALIVPVLTLGLLIVGE